MGRSAQHVSQSKLDREVSLNSRAFKVYFERVCLTYGECSLNYAPRFRLTYHAVHGRVYLRFALDLLAQKNFVTLDYLWRLQSRLTRNQKETFRRYDRQ
jgi:hypothetical protein